MAAHEVDRDLASDVLVRIKSLHVEDDRVLDEKLAVLRLLEMDRTAALVASTFLAKLPCNNDMALTLKGSRRQRRKMVEATRASSNWQALTSIR
ncbi:hypothetical protein [Variovorax sp. W6]|uniref:hypothetical protein n=1 Tax=Variovorax sp. W6 TaxID=3093895 RepID=UPI003D802226